MTMTAKQINEFATKYDKADKAQSQGIVDAKEGIGDKERSFQLATVDMGVTLSNFKPSREDCDKIAKKIAGHKVALKTGDPRAITEASQPSVESKLKSLIYCGAMGWKTELEAELADVMAKLATRKIDRKVQNVRLSLYSKRMKGKINGEEVANAAEAGTLVMDGAIKAQTKKTDAAAAAADYTAVERAAVAIDTGINRVLGHLSEEDKASFAGIVKAVKALLPSEDKTSATEAAEIAEAAAAAAASMPANEMTPELTALFAKMQNK